MKKILIIATALFISSCVEPIMNPDQYRVVDTLKANKNGFNQILSYDVIVEYDSAFYLGSITPDGNLTEFTFVKLNTNDWK